MASAKAQMPPVREEELHAYLTLRKQWAEDPVRYAVERLGLRPTWQQKKLFEALAPEGAKVSCRAGHGIGKSGCTSGAALWFLETRDYAKIPCTAPTSHQLRDVLWAEIGKWARKSADVSLKRGDHPRFWLTNLFTFTKDRIYDTSAASEWFAVARTSGRDNPDALQGFHASDLEISEDGMGVVGDEHGEGKIFFIIDEASGVFEKVFEVAEGALSSHGARLLMLGNPTRTSGYFHMSHHHGRSEFTCLHFSSAESPLVSSDYRAGLVRKYGEGSNVVRVRCDGEFPKQDDDTLIPLEHCEPCITREPYDDTGEIRIGADVARFGNDRVVLTVRQERNLLHAEIHAKQDTMTTAGMIVNLANSFGARKVFVDVVGLGAGVVDRLREIRKEGKVKAQIIEVNVAQASPKRFNPYEDGEESVEAQGFRLRDYLWLEGARWIAQEKPSFSMIDNEIAQDLAAELATVKYSIDSSGRLLAESKDEMKKRLGHSPDIADSLLLTFAPEGVDDHVLAAIGLERESPWS
jgi:hypothetical protein